MARPPHASDTRSLQTLTPLSPTRLICDRAAHIAYYASRRVTTLTGSYHLRLAVRHCSSPVCSRYHQPYRPEAEGAWALPHGEYGLDVIALVGFLRGAQDLHRTGRRTDPRRLRDPLVTTLCPSGATVPCEVPTDGIHVALFVGACFFYLLQVVATGVCFILRATRPVALGLLVMPFLGPVIASVAITYVFEARAPRTDAAGPLLLLPVFPVFPVLVGVVARRRL